MLQRKKILLGVTGSIAGYKSAVLCRLLINEGYDVKVVMTPSSKDFITPLTLSTLSGNEAMYDISDGNSWNNHVELGLWADLMLIAPCTASTLSKMANGHADNLLLACYLSSKCPVCFAPAMDLDMWKHPSTLNNVNRLVAFGNMLIPVGNGFLASGLVGEGRMAEPEDIVQYIHQYFIRKTDLSGKKILITAGPTYESIDPVRFIGNRSSGKMGFAIARECLERGATVTLIAGPVNLDIESDQLSLIRVQSAAEMYEAAKNPFESADIIILSAAVADFKPVSVAREKIKKSENHMQLELEKTVDIAATLGSKKGTNQILVGFALETNDEINHAKQKLHKKNLDFIVLNSLNDSGAGFQHDTNKVTILDKTGNQISFPLKSKKEVASDIINYIISSQQ